MPKRRNNNGRVVGICNNNYLARVPNNNGINDALGGILLSAGNVEKLQR